MEVVEKLQNKIDMLAGLCDKMIKQIDQQDLRIQELEEEIFEKEEEEE